MNLQLNCRKGSILFYTLLLLIIVCGFILIETQKYSLYLQGQKYRQDIIKRLQLEYEIAVLLNLLDSSFESNTYTVDNYTIHIEKNEQNYHVSVSGASETHYKYAIISDDSLKWRQIE